MSHVIPISKVNQFLPIHKMGLDETMVPQTGLPVDHYKIADFEETARGIVLSHLRPLYNTEGWLEPVGPNQPSAAPELVVAVTGMLVAGWVFDRQFAEENTEGSTYGARKVREAYALLAGIVDGTYDLGVDLLIDPLTFPLVHESDPVFTMDMRP